MKLKVGELAKRSGLTVRTLHRDEWQAVIAQVRALMEAGVPVADARAQQLSRDWMVMLERDTSGDADVAVRLHAMLEQEPSVQLQSGVTPEIRQYVSQAFSTLKQAAYAKYLDADEMQRMRENAGKDAARWPALVAGVRRLMDAGAAPDDPAMQALAREWLELFRNFAGDKLETRDKLRTAYRQESLLLTGTWMNEELMAFVRASAQSLQAG